MNTVEDIRKQVFGTGGSDQEQVFTLVRAMEIVGGYSELMNMPISSLNQVIKYLQEEARQMKKGMPGGKK